MGAFHLKITPEFLSLYSWKDLAQVSQKSSKNGTPVRSARNVLCSIQQFDWSYISWVNAKRPCHVICATMVRVLHEDFTFTFSCLIIISLHMWEEFFLTPHGFLLVFLSLYFSGFKNSARQIKLSSVIKSVIVLLIH